MKHFRLIMLVGIVAIILLTTFGLKRYSSPEQNLPRPDTKPEIGFSAPDFTLKNLQGQSVSLSSLRGKPVYLNFWASWCPPCKQEMPEIEKFYQKYRGQVEILAVNLTFDDKLEDIQALLTELKTTFPVLLDQDGKNHVTDAYQVYGIPASFFIDKYGVIRDTHVGPMTLNTLETAIRKAM